MSHKAGEHHKKAPEHHEQAAKHHNEAAGRKRRIMPTSLTVTLITRRTCPRPAAGDTVTLRPNNEYQR